MCIRITLSTIQRGSHGDIVLWVIDKNSSGGGHAGAIHIFVFVKRIYLHELNHARHGISDIGLHAQHNIGALWHGIAFLKY